MYPEVFLGTEGRTYILEKETITYRQKKLSVHTPTE